MKLDVSPITLHSTAETARLMHVSVTCVERMVAAGQLVTVTPAGAAHPRITGASILAFAQRVPEPPPVILRVDSVRELLDRKRGTSEPALAPLFSEP